ncbi:MAG: tetratricopeptide repeat protein [Ignavibacteriaceae bacterium]|jgi:tetratricopeptide (TPR) repeat protein|nr:tetratricopeptide repeat protein [Ignavibacteriaceae bacterium]
MKKLIFAIFFLFIVSMNFSQDLNSAKNLLQNNKLSEAKSTLEKLINNDKNNAEAHFYLGKTLLRMKEYEDASDEFEAAIKINYNNADYHFWFAQAMGQDALNSSVFTQIKLAPRIKDEYMKTVQINPAHVQGRMGLIGFYRRAPGIMGGSMEKAYSEAKILIGYDEKLGHSQLANLYVADKNNAKAEEEFKFLENKYGKQKDFSGFYNGYGYFLLSISRNDEAILKFKKQVELDPNNPNSYDSLGDGYLAAGNKTEAIAQFKKALEVDPNFTASQKKLKDLTK